LQTHGRSPFQIQSANQTLFRGSVSADMSIRLATKGTSTTNGLTEGNLSCHSKRAVVVPKDANAATGHQSEGNRRNHHLRTKHSAYGNLVKQPEAEDRRVSSRNIPTALRNNNKRPASKHPLRTTRGRPWRLLFPNRVRAGNSSRDHARGVK
jgi:hypothetical protein